MAARIGIDFGTANTVVASWNESLERGEPIPLEGLDLPREATRGINQRVIPSLIAYDTKTPRMWIGAQVVNSPRCQEEDDVMVFQATKSNVSGRAFDAPRPTHVGPITGKQAATQFLTDVMTAAALAVDSDDLEIVATAPIESFDNYRDWLVRDVSEAVGLSRLRVVDEATAAAVGYSARLHPGQAFMVFDFGAGTLDISVVKVLDPNSVGGGAAVRTIAKAGLDLGGNHIDALIATHVAERTGVPYGDTGAYQRVFRRLLTSSEKAKVNLTREEEAVISATDPSDASEYALTLSRRDFDALLRERTYLEW